jgi:hypothetical protein
MASRAVDPLQRFDPDDHGRRGHRRLVRGWLLAA